MAIYDPKSRVAEEFINDQEIRDTLAYAEEHKSDVPLLMSILDKAAQFKGLTHREAAVLLACDVKEVNDRIFETAIKVKEHIYGSRIVLFAPLYLSNYCVNTCTYCPYHAKNKSIVRKKLTQEEIRNEVIALQDLGHKRLLLEAGEHPKHNPIEYILESIKTIYSIKHKNGAIRRLNVNIAATTVENYRKLHEAEIGTYQPLPGDLQPQGLRGAASEGTEVRLRLPHRGARTAPWKAASTTWVSAYSSGLISTATTSSACSCTPSILKPSAGVGPHTISVPRI